MRQDRPHLWPRFVHQPAVAGHPHEALHIDGDQGTRLRQLLDDGQAHLAPHGRADDECPGADVPDIRGGEGAGRAGDGDDPLVYVGRGIVDAQAGGRGIGAGEHVDAQASEFLDDVEVLPRQPGDSRHLEPHAAGHLSAVVERPAIDDTRAGRRHDCVLGVMPDKDDVGSHMPAPWTAGIPARPCAHFPPCSPPAVIPGSGGTGPSAGARGRARPR